MTRLALAVTRALNAFWASLRADYPEAFKPEAPFPPAVTSALEYYAHQAASIWVRLNVGPLPEDRTK